VRLLGVTIRTPGIVGQGVGGDKNSRRAEGAGEDNGNGRLRQRRGDAEKNGDGDDSLAAFLPLRLRAADW